jgi:hypothetical protein
MRMASGHPGLSTPDQHVLAREQFSSRKHKRSNCLRLSVLTPVSRGMCANDLKSCYDRVIHAIASLSMRRVGMPSEPIICMFTTIEDLEHHIRTICGDSKKSFGRNLWLVPCQGLGQRNGAGPQMWAVVSTPVLYYLHTEGYGVAFKTSISGDVIRFVGYAFVDALRYLTDWAG